MQSLTELTAKRLEPHLLSSLPYHLQEFVLDCWRKEHKSKLDIEGFGTIKYYVNEFNKAGYDVIEYPGKRWSLYKNYYTESMLQYIGDICFFRDEVVHVAGLQMVVLRPQYLLKLKSAMIERS